MALVLDSVVKLPRSWPNVCAEVLLNGFWFLRQRSSS